MSCILCHRGVQLILAYSWARPAILVAGKGREVVFLCLLFLHFHSCSSFFPVIYDLYIKVTGFLFHHFYRGGRVVQRCHVSYVTGASS